MTITIKENDFTLHACGAVYWVQKDILLISDVHLGKIAHFRKHGVALPPGSALKNYKQMTAAIDLFRAGTVIFLGDLFHSVKNGEWEQFDAWVTTVPSRLILVAGNHDIISESHYRALGIDVVSEAIVDGFLLTHHPEVRDGFFNFCGHIHPSVRLRGFGRQSLKLPCFFHTRQQMILPAFGHFTGTYEMVPQQGDCVYAIANDKVVVVCEGN
jgi:DNA ligase-associated metallophosphoesterase